MVQPQGAEDAKKEIVTQIAEMSRLLEEMSGGDAKVQQARDVHLKLSMLIGKALDISMP